MNIEKLQADLAALCNQESAIVQKLHTATDALDQARDNMNGLESSTSALIKAQTAFDALQGALANSVKRIDEKRREIRDAEAQAQREQDLEQLQERQKAYTDRLDSATARGAELVNELNSLDEMEREFSELALEFSILMDEADRLDQRAEIYNAGARRNQIIGSIKLAPVRDGIASALNMHWIHRATATAPQQKAA